MCLCVLIRQQAALARLGRSPALVAEAAARGDKQAAQALVAQIRVQESSKVQRLKAVRKRGYLCFGCTWRCVCWIFRTDAGVAPSRALWGT